MALTETPPQPYELLHRWDEVTGAYKGGHFLTITTVLRDGVPVSSTPSDPQPASACPALEAVVGKLAADLQALADEQAATIAAQTAELAAKDANIQALLAQVEALTTQVLQEGLKPWTPADLPRNPGPGSAAEPDLGS